MTNTELSKLRSTLENRHAALVGFLHNRDAMNVVSSADSLDQIQNASERDMAIGDIERDTTRLRDVKDALQRMQLGTFGICSECEDEITAKRLAAVPWTNSCLACTEAADGIEPRFQRSREMTFLLAA
ncbi:MAG TPA: TraR/DksA C4-type zinc finger protein [Bryobacteraceae bacterium]|nr:TraR/DksA C4-type zinc finger protein [Bryobacteraceae bacterium]